LTGLGHLTGAATAECKFEPVSWAGSVSGSVSPFDFLQSNLVGLLVAQNTGTAVRLDNAQVFEAVEAANRARIQAELEDEAQQRQHAQNVVRLAATDQLNSEIITNRT